MKLIIRPEEKNDYKETEAVIQQAFALAEESDGNEHQLVARLRKTEAFIPALSLVARREPPGDILGQVLLTKISIKNGEKETESLALAPVSVLPEYQGQGIGKALIQQALEEAKKLGFQSVIVLGHPEYYPKFGFKKATLFKIEAPFDVPEEAFMVLELEKDSLKDIEGVVQYSSAFFES